MNAEEYGKIIEESAVEKDGKKMMPCVRAFELSERSGISLKDIGEYCTTSGIKIVGCQLGCFD